MQLPAQTVAHPAPHLMSNVGQTATWLAGEQTSGKDAEPDPRWQSWFIAYVPLADICPLSAAFVMMARLIFGSAGKLAELPGPGTIKDR